MEYQEEFFWQLTEVEKHLLQEFVNETKQGKFFFMKYHLPQSKISLKNFVEKNDKQFFHEVVWNLTFEKVHQ